MQVREISLEAAFMASSARQRLRGDAMNGTKGTDAMNELARYAARSRVQCSVAVIDWRDFWQGELGAALARAFSSRRSFSWRSQSWSTAMKPLPALLIG